MRRNFALVLGVALVLLAGSVASAAMVQEMAFAGSSGASPSQEVLFSQLDGPSGSAQTDQAFEGAYAAYDAEGADDFDVTAFSWTIETVFTPGTLSVAGATPFFVNMLFYADAGGLPGAVLDDCDFTGNTNVVAPGTGDLTITVDCDAPQGINWFSQQVRQDFNPFGQHFWGTRTAANNNPAVWRNPGNGFGNNCLDWQPANAVCGNTGEDWGFELSGVRNDQPTGTPAVGPFGAALLILSLGAGSAYVLRRRR